jgi:predicted nucleic acid-binding protein
MNVIDSSAWLEYFANGPNASFFARAIEQTDGLVVPSLTLYEVFKKVLQQTDEGHALQAIAVMQQGTVIDLDARLALDAAHISIAQKLPMADSIILATAQSCEATLWTQDEDFKNIPGVQFRRKKP